MAALLALVGPVVGYLLGMGVRRWLQPGWRTLWGIFGVVLLLEALAATSSARFHGPAVNYQPGSLGLAIRGWLVAPGIRALPGLPAAFALVAAAGPAPRFKLPAVLILAYGAMVPLFFVVLFASCNFAGACL